jgi:hypothetical protein
VIILSVIVKSVESTMPAVSRLNVINLCVTFITYGNIERYFSSVELL